MCLQPLHVKAQDSTKNGIGRAKFSIFFKRYFDFKNIGSARRYRKAEKSTSNLTYPWKKGKYGLAFEDNFDSFNNTKWQKGQPWGRFHGQYPHQYYGDTEVFVSNGILHLQNRYAPIKVNQADSQITIPYGTGLINSYYSFNATYGYFAIRSKNPPGAATWPAFWLTGRYNWPPEIDIFEMYGRCTGKDIHKQTMSIHFGKIENRTKGLLAKSTQLPSNTDTCFHIYSCLWEPNCIKFYTDGVHLKTIKLNKWMKQFYSEPMYIILNNAVDHRYLNCIDKAQLPSTFEVDWIKVFQRID